MRRIPTRLSRLLATALVLHLGLLPAAFMQGCGRETPPSLRAVAFDVDEDALEGATARERLDQLRDWLLLTALSDAKLPAGKLIQATSDLPPVRHGYLRPVSNYEYGEVRSRRIGDDEVLALLPADKPAARGAYLADVADEHRKETGAAPAKLRVASYKLDADKLSASLGQFETIEGKELFKEKYGYREATIKGAADLEQFLKQIDDITLARVTDGGLVLGGRKLKDYPARGLRVEDVAALWQSEESISARRAALLAPAEARLAEFNSRWQKKIDEFNARWTGQTYSTEAEREELLRRRQQELSQLEKLKEKEWAQLEREAAQYQKEAEAKARKEKIVSGSGFSLDPHYDYEELSRLMPQVASTILSSKAGGPAGAEVGADIQKARAGLAARDANPFYALVSKYNVRLANFADGKSVDELISDRSYSYQLARYDGELRGTEVGMVLFYTDLLSKLWAIDYLHATPTDIADFKPLTRVAVAPVHREEAERLTGTRVWFGPREQAYQAVNGGDTLLFARNVTRVFAASHAGVESDRTREEPPSPAADAFIGWWNDHYDEVARREPEYLRLNQIMKWSLVIGWLNNAKKGGALGFLGGENVKVDHGRWFPDWARQQNLRFKEWDKAGFFERGFNGAEAEAMHLLSSEPFDKRCDEETIRWRVLTGGVSLANRGVFEKRAPLSADNPLSQMARRAVVDPKSVSPDGSGFRTIEGTEVRYRVESPTNAQVTETAAEGTKLYTRTSARAPAANYEQEVTTRPGGTTFDFKVGGEAACDLEAAKDGLNYRVSWHARDTLKAESLARRMSRAPESQAARILASDPDVSRLVSLPDGQHLVRMRGSQNWFRFGGPQMQDATSSVSASEPGARVIGLARVDAAAALRELTGGKYVKLRTLGEGDTGWLIEVIDREPAAAAKPLELRSGDVTLSGRVEPESGDVYFPLKELPQALREDPSLIEQQLGYADLTRVHELARTEGEVRYARVVRPVMPEELAPVSRLTAEYKYDEAARELDRLMATHGRSPDLALLKGSVLIKEGRLGEAVNISNQFPEPLQDVRQFYDQLYEMYRRGTGALGRANLRHYEEYVRRREYVAGTGGKTGEAVSLVTEGDKLDYEVHGLKMAFEKVAPPDPSAGRDSTFYVMDDPRLNGLDWQGNFEGSLNRAVSGDFDVYAVTPDDLRDAAPHRVFDPEGRRFTRVRVARQASDGVGQPAEGAEGTATAGGPGPFKFRPYLDGLGRGPGGGPGGTGGGGTGGGHGAGGDGTGDGTGGPVGAAPCGEEDERPRVYVVMGRRNQ
jgi:hypothetical protein